MPSTKDATFQLIQREISDHVQREKELRENYSRAISENGIITSNGSNIHYKSKPVLERAKSVSSLTNGHSSSSNGVRLFTQNPTKGVMQRFIKSRGKIAAVSGATNKQQAAPMTWTSLDIPEPPKAVVPPGMQPRNGFVPIEERIRKEFQEMQVRETEWRSEREKSQPDLLALLGPHSPEPERRTLRSSRSISQLDDLDDDNTSAPCSLKTARSLADLCDAEDDETQPPGSLTLIKQWESLIQKNRQDLN